MKKNILSEKPNAILSKHDSSALVRAAGDFAQRERPSQQEIATFKELFYTLALKSPSDENRELSTLLSQSVYTPRPIVLFFAMHRIEFATPMLRYSAVLNETDLVSIVLKLRSDHAKVIAQRSDITPHLTSAILSIDTDDKFLLKQLLQNKHIEAKAEIQSMLQSARVHKPLAPIEVHDETKIVRSILTAPMISEQGQDLSDALLTMASRGGKLGKSKNARFSQRPNTLTERQAQLLRASRNLNRQAFAFCVEEACAIKHETTLKALADKDTGLIATILVALDMPKRHASQILLLMTPDVGRNLKVFQLVLDRLSTMNRDDCISYLERLGAKFDGQNETSRFARIASKRKRQIEAFTIPAAITSDENVARVPLSSSPKTTENFPRVANNR